MGKEFDLGNLIGVIICSLILGFTIGILVSHYYSKTLTSITTNQFEEFMFGVILLVILTIGGLLFSLNKFIRNY